MSGSRRQAEQYGLPAGFKTVSPFPFAGMNQSASRIGMDDKQFFWLENYIKVGDGKLRTLNDNGPSVYTAPTGLTIVFPFFYNIGSQDYIAVFLSDGSAVQLTYPGFVGTTIGPAGTFYNAANGQLPACTQSGTQYLLIANHNAKSDFWIWDGTILYQSGSMAPITNATITDGGQGYTSAPTATAFGGSGSGIQLTAVVDGGSVVALTVTNPGVGYLPGDIIQVAFSGGGSDTSAQLAAQITANNVSYLTLINGGIGYTAGTFALAFSGGGGGAGAAGTFTVVGGAVTNIKLTDGGSGYVNSPTISFAASSGGSGAAAVASLSAGTVSIVIVNDGGTGFTGTPTITIQGGGGTGATGIAVVSGGTITSVTTSNGGSGYTSAPTVIVQNGVNRSAAATLSLMPFGVSGTSIETYQSRVWLSYPNEVGKQNNGGTFDFSAPGSLTDFATSDGGGNFVNSDRFLRKQYTFLRQSLNYLYEIGDSSVSYLSNVQTSGSTASTTFNNQNIDPQSGSSWRDSAADYGNTILFANPFGVWGLYGGAVTRVSDQIDDIFNNAIFPPANGALTPTAAVANVYNRKVYLLLLTVMDPFTSAPRNVMLMWDKKEWYVASQSAALTFIQTQEIDSDLSAWGTDGKSLYQLFQSQSKVLPKILSTKQYGGSTPFMISTAYSMYLVAADLSSAKSGVTFKSATVDSVGTSVPILTASATELQTVPSISVQWDEPISFDASSPSGAMYGSRAPEVPGIALGLTLVSTSPAYEIRMVSLGYTDTTAIA